MFQQTRPTRESSPALRPLSRGNRTGRATSRLCNLTLEGCFSTRSSKVFRSKHVKGATTVTRSGICDTPLFTQRSKKYILDGQQTMVTYACVKCSYQVFLADLYTLNTSKVPVPICLYCQISSAMSRSEASKNSIREGWLPAIGDRNDSWELLWCPVVIVSSSGPTLRMQ